MEVKIKWQFNEMIQLAVWLWSIFSLHSEHCCHVHYYCSWTNWVKSCWLSQNQISTEIKAKFETDSSLHLTLALTLLTLLT